MRKLTMEQQSLVTNNHNLIYSFLNKNNLSIEEWYDVAAIGLCKAAAGYQNEKAAFVTYAYICMDCAVKIEKRKERAQKYISDDKLIYYDQSFQPGEEDQKLTILDRMAGKDNTEEAATANLILEKLPEKLKEKEIKVMEFFSLGFTQKEIAKKMGYSQQQISRIRKKIQEVIKAV